MKRAFRWFGLTAAVLLLAFSLPAGAQQKRDESLHFGAGASVTRRKPRCDIGLYGSLPRRALGR